MSGEQHVAAVLRPWTRRQWLGVPVGVAAAMAAGSRPARAHVPLGVLNPPEPVPGWRLRMSDGATRPLAGLLHGHVTALQLMFTGCSASCPIQGAQFAQLQTLLPSDRQAAPVRLLSVSIDALGDDAARMQRWLNRWPAQPLWQGGVVLPDELDSWLRVLGGASRNPQDAHTPQVYLFDTRARLAWRSAAWPSPQGVLQALQALRGR